MGQCFTLITENADTLDECVKCLVSFGCCRYTDLSLQAIDFLLQCAHFLGEHPTDPNAPEELGGHLKVWFLLLTGLSNMVNLTNA
jgi:hypothetical protein